LTDATIRRLISSWSLVHPETDEHALVRFRTFIVLRHWISEYYIQDFASSRSLRYLMIISFINDLCDSPVIRSKPRDYRLVKTLKKLLKQQDSEYKSLKSLHINSQASCNLASWVHQMKLEKHFESVYYPILMFVQKEKRGSDFEFGGNRDSGISRSSSFRTTNSSSGLRSTVADSGMIGEEEEEEKAAAAIEESVHWNISEGIPQALGSLVTTKKSFLLSFRTEVIAQQFFLIEEMILLSIPWSDLVVHGAHPREAGPIQNMIERFNMVHLSVNLT
jgi:hypothetical protein